jgi:hypothetical protein
MEACFIALCKGDRAEWTLEADIKSCFDHISHEWLLAHIPMDKTILRKWLKAGYMEKGHLSPTEQGTPQGGICSPVIANMALDGLEPLLASHFPKRGKAGTRAKVNLVRYADDFIVTGVSKELLEQEVKPLVEHFLRERGLELSPEKTVITHIDQGFDAPSPDGPSIPGRKTEQVFHHSVKEEREGLSLQETQTSQREPKRDGRRTDFRPQSAATWMGTVSPSRGKPSKWFTM